MKKILNSAKIGVLLVLLLVANGCEKEFGNWNKVNGPAITFYALTDGNVLDRYVTTFPQRIFGTAYITGLQDGEKILAIDFRPATGQLYGLGSTNRLYIINPETGTARMVGVEPFTPALSGNLVGFDFNPMVDRIRLVTNSGQNLRLNPETGTLVAEDGKITGFDNAKIAAVAYGNNTAGTAVTNLYAIDVNQQRLFEINPPNNGTLVKVGHLKLDVTGDGGFDVDPKTNTGLGLFKVGKKSTLFTIDVKTGKTKVLADYEKKVYTGIAIVTLPVAYAVTNANATNSLLIFNPTKASVVVSKPITGLATGEKVLGIDFRPLNGQLYALGSTSRIYTVNASSGLFTEVGVLSTPLSGTAFGFDFNPVVDRIRIVSNKGQNLRVNPLNAVALVDSTLNPGMPAVTAAAYANNFAGTAATMLFDIDVNKDKLYMQSPPNEGKLVEIGSLGVNVEAANGFDIGGTSNIGYALLTSGGRTVLYAINTTTGGAVPIENFSSSVSGFTLGLGF